MTEANIALFIFIVYLFYLMFRVKKNIRKIDIKRAKNTEYTCDIAKDMELEDGYRYIKGYIESSKPLTHACIIHIIQWQIDKLTSD